MVEASSPFISSSMAAPITIPRMDDIHNSVKTRLKEAAKVVQDLAPLYKLIIEFHKSLETSKKIGEQVAQKFVEIGLSRVNSDWGQSYVTIGELQHNLNKNMETWISTIKTISTSYLHKASDRDKEDIHTCIKGVRGSLSSLESLEGVSGDRKSVGSSIVNLKDLRNMIEKKRCEIFCDIDILERGVVFTDVRVLMSMQNGKCGSLAQKWVEVMAHQPFSTNTSILDKFSKMKRIPSRSFAGAPLADMISPRSLERSMSFSHVSVLPSPVPLGAIPTPTSSPILPKRGLSHTVSQSTFPQNYSPNLSPVLHTPMSLTPSSSREFKMAATPAPAAVITPATSTSNSGLSIKNFFGKIGKSIAPSTSPRSAQAMEVPKEEPSKTASTPVINANASATTKPKHSIGTLKKRRHTIVTSPDAVAKECEKASLAPDTIMTIMCPPKRNFAYRQEEVC